MITITKAAAKVLLQEAVEKRSNNGLWKWRVIGITADAGKQTLEIGWGYLDYLSEKEGFKIAWNIDEEGDEFITHVYKGELIDGDVELMNRKDSPKEGITERHVRAMLLKLVSWAESVF